MPHATKHHRERQQADRHSTEQPSLSQPSKPVYADNRAEARALDTMVAAIDGSLRVADQRAFVRRVDDSPYMTVQRRQHASRFSETGPNAGASTADLPTSLRAGVEALSGIAMDDVRVHYESPMPRQLQALAFTQGKDIHLAPGQAQHLPHEAWHVVQQAQGRVQPTLQMKGGVGINDERALECEADVMGAAAAAGHAAPPARLVRNPAAGTILQMQMKGSLTLAGSTLASEKAADRGSYTQSLLKRQDRTPTERELRVGMKVSAGRQLSATQHPTLIQAGLWPGSVKGRKVALVIGNSHYTKAPLPGAWQDARKMERHLKRIGYETFPYPNLSAGEFHPAFDWTASQVLDGDRYFFYYAGHGVPDGMVSTDTNPADPRVRLVPYAPFLQKLEKMASDGIHATFVSDACHSGAAVTKTQEITRVKALEHVAKTANPKVKAIESQIKRLQGLFTALPRIEVRADLMAAAAGGKQAAAPVMDDYTTFPDLNKHWKDVLYPELVQVLPSLWDYGVPLEIPKALDPSLDTPRNMYDRDWAEIKSIIDRVVDALLKVIDIIEREEEQESELSKVPAR